MPESPWSRLNGIRLLILFGTIGFLLSVASRGVDFSDESFFFASIAYPDRLGATIHPFGYLISVLFSRVGNSFVALRIVGILTLALSGAFLGWRLDVECRRSSSTNHSLWQVGALTALSSYGLWTLTPTYNHLIVMAMCLIFGGVLWWRANDHAHRHLLDKLASLCVGFGGFVACFAKPPVAVIAAVAVVVFLALTRNRQSAKRLLTRSVLTPMIAAVFSVLTLTATVGVWAFEQTIKNGLTYIRFGNSPLALVGKTVSDFYYGSPVVWVTLTSALIFALTFNESNASPWRKVSAVLLAGCAIFFIFNIANGIRVGEAPFAFIGVATFCLAVSALLFLFVRHPVKLTGAQVGIALVLLALPFVLSFGSAISIFAQTGAYVSFTLLGAVYFAVSGLPVRSARIVEAGTFALVPLLILWSATDPFGLPRSIFAQSTPITSPFSQDQFLVDPSTANYVANLRKIARDNALNSATPIIDFTGTGPGTGLFLGARLPYYPWLISFIGDPLPVANAQWASLSESDRKRAWMIGPIPPALVASMSARYFVAHHSDYRLAGCLIARTRLDRPHRLVFWAPGRLEGPPPFVDCA